MTTWICVLGGLLIVGVSIPLIRRSVPPNPWYGFRTPKTLGSRENWYDANRFLRAYAAARRSVHRLRRARGGCRPAGGRLEDDGRRGNHSGSVLWAAATSFAYLQKL